MKSIQDIFIGVDGGATQLTLRVENAIGGLLGQSDGGPANIRISAEKSWQSIYQALDKVLKSSGIELTDNQYRFHIGLGLAGCEVTSAVDTFLSAPHPFSTIKLTSDAHVACLGAHQGNDGAVIVVGTGVIGYEYQQGKSTRVGGWGFPHDDEGGGAWLGLQAAHLTFQWLDGRREKSSLVEDVFGFFNNDVEEFTTWANYANSREFARLAPIVITHVQKDEPSAIAAIKKAAQAIDRIGVTLLTMQRERDKQLPCSLFGGIAPFIEPWLCDDLRASLVPKTMSADKGAILMIRDHYSAMNKVAESL